MVKIAVKVKRSAVVAVGKIIFTLASSAALVALAATLIVWKVPEFLVVAGSLIVIFVIHDVAVWIGTKKLTKE